MAGGDGNDRLFGGSGDDLLDGNAGADRRLARLTATTCSPGTSVDGSDTRASATVAATTLDFNGSDAPERFTVTANGSRARLTRNLGNFTMDLDSLETARVRTFGGEDSATVGDLTGTELELVAFDDKNLTDAADPDALVVDGTPGPDRVTASSPQPGTLRLSGLAADRRARERRRGRPRRRQRASPAPTR